MKMFFKVYWPQLACVAMWVLLLMVACGCTRTVYVPMHSARVDSTRVSGWRVDSVVVRDSVYLHEFTQGDTVWIMKYKERVKWRERVVRDTVEAVRSDTVSVPYPVERELTIWERTKMDWGGWAMLAVFVTILVVVGRTVYKLMI